MRFSVIVPVFNTATLLRNCIGSVIGQACEDWELILVDDGSSDGSESIIDDYSGKDERIMAFHQENSGAFMARRKGICKASGDYILFLDGDDQLELECLDRLSTVIDERDPDIIMFTGKCHADGSDTGRRFGYIRIAVHFISSDLIKRSLISSHDHNSLCTKAIRRSLFDGDDNDYEDMTGRRIGEDKVQLLYPLGRAYEIYYIPDELYIYNMRAGSAIHSIDFDSAECLLANEMFSHVWSCMQQWNMTGPTSTEAFSAYYIRNFLSVYYGFRGKCRTEGEIRKFRKYRWPAVNRKMIRFSKSKLLTPREKLKLLAAKLHL